MHPIWTLLRCAMAAALTLFLAAWVAPAAAQPRALVLAPGQTIEAGHLMFAGGSLPAPAASLAAVSPSPEAAEIPASMKDLERQHILETLLAVGGSRLKAVEILGISERTLRYKLKQYRDEGLL